MEAPGEAATGGGPRGRLGFQPCRAGGAGDRGPLRSSRELPGTCIIVRLWAGSKKALRVQRRAEKEAGAGRGRGSASQRKRGERREVGPQRPRWCWRRRGNRGRPRVKEEVAGERGEVMG